MTVFEESRWYALMDAIDVIACECEKRNKDFNKLKISPLDVEKYINATHNIYIKQIEENRKCNENNLGLNPQFQLVENTENFNVSEV